MCDHDGSEDATIVRKTQQIVRCERGDAQKSSYSFEKSQSGLHNKSHLKFMGRSANARASDKNENTNGAEFSAVANAGGG
jgi:hypothetical protein